jgi:hypothetical protein
VERWLWNSWEWKDDWGMVGITKMVGGWLAASMVKSDPVDHFLYST